MAIDVRKVHERGSAAFQAAYKEAEWEYQQAAVNEDVDGMASAGMKLAGLEATYEKFNSLADRAINPAPPGEPVNHYGLTASEVDVARNSFSAKDMTDDQKQRLYVHNKSKYRNMVATGQYSNDQGAVRR
jgi:hypothetical protein